MSRYSDAKDAHQDTKLTFHDLKEVARKGWLFAKDRLLEASSGQAIVTAVEKLARFLKRERLAETRNLDARPEKLGSADTEHDVRRPKHNPTIDPSTSFKP